MNETQEQTINNTIDNPIKQAAVGPLEAGPAFTALMDRLAGMEKQISLLPAQVRMLTARVDGLSTAIAEPRLRSLLSGLLGVFDLIDQVLRTWPADAAASDLTHKRNYEVLRTQVALLLETNGLYQIPVVGAFDPQVHRAVESVTVEDPTQSGMIVEVVRPGFRTDQAILRFAEVSVGRCAAAPSAPTVPPIAAAEPAAADAPLNQDPTEEKRS